MPSRAITRTIAVVAAATLLTACDQRSFPQVALAPGSCTDSTAASSTAPAVTPATATVAVGDSVRLNVAGTTCSAGRFTWSSDNGTVARVTSAGWVVGVGAGQANITATSTVNGARAGATITVVRAGTAPAPTNP